MKKIAVIGAGGFGREVKMLIDHINKQEVKYKFIGFYDDGFEKGTLINDCLVLGGIEDINEREESLCIALGVADPILKADIINRITNLGIVYPTLKHPSAIVGGDEVFIGKGTIICAGVIITCNINIGEFVTLNLLCTVGHDTEIEDYSSFMPSVNISGEVIVHKKVYVGTGAKIINQLEIGERTIVGAGAVVSKSLPSDCTAVGVPAKPIKFHESIILSK